MTSSGDGGAPHDDASQQMRYRNEGIRSLLAAFSEGDPDQVLRVREILADLQQSAFGVFLFLAILPSFIPIPGVAGGISLKNARDYLSLPNVVCVGGSWVAPKELIEAGDWAGITKLASEAFALKP